MFTCLRLIVSSDEERSTWGMPAAFALGALLLWISNLAPVRLVVCSILLISGTHSPAQNRRIDDAT